MQLVKILFSPVVWSIGFLTPLIAQMILLLNGTDSPLSAYLAAGVVALPWGVMAQLRGSWV